MAFSPRSGKVFELQLNISDAPVINGWSVLIEYDPSAVQFVSGSFVTSQFIGGLIGLTDEGETTVSVGGTVLGTDAQSSGDGTLGSISFELTDGFDTETDISITYITLKLVEGETTKLDVYTSVTITDEVSLYGDFDGNNVVDFDDFFSFADAFGGTNVAFDADGDGVVGFDDFFAFADNFGRDERAKLLALARQYIGLPFATELEEVFPNPFNSSTVIRYHVAQPEEISVDVFGMTGQKVRALASDLQHPGIYELTWDGRNDAGSAVSTGVYFVRIQTEASATARKLTYMK